MTPTTIIQILAAGIASSVIGFFWYNPRLFGRAWMKFEGITPEMTERALRNKHALALGGVCTGIVVAFVINYFETAQGIFYWMEAVGFAFFAWVGFVVPVLLGQLLWEQKPPALFFINASYWLIALIAIALIVVL